MADPGLAREARRRPEMDLLVGPIEAAERTAGSPDADAASPDPSDGSEEPAWREDG